VLGQGRRSAAGPGVRCPALAALVAGGHAELERQAGAGPRPTHPVPPALPCLQALPPGARIISIEKELSWVLAAKRFLWQASQGEKSQGAEQRLGDRVGGAAPAPCCACSYSRCCSAERLMPRAS
jgi:hypothetical protein